MTKRIGILYFSPTNTTKKICNAIALGMGENAPVKLNITKPDFRERLISNPDAILDNIDHLIIGAPVYAGKLPLQVIESLKTITGNGKECTIVVVYENRDYGVALKNLAEILTENRFKIKAAGAFIGQHSYSEIIPIAIGRPDKNDLELAYNFGKNCISNSKHLAIAEIPKQIDWISKSKSYFKSVTAKYISENCTQCGICAKHCPTGIIAAETGDYIRKEAKANCIGCMACVFKCKNEARIIEANFLIKFILRTHLRKASVKRLEPLVIFP